MLINNRYKILKKIGEGGAGVVFLASDRLRKNEIIAIKKLNPGFGSPKNYDSLKNEFDALTRLNHPNLIKIFDLGIIKESGELFLTMEYLKGKNLLEIHDSLDHSNLIEIVIQICRALDYIHSKGIIHGDIKPENIFVLMQDGRLTVKLMDFGLARAVQSIRQEIGGTLIYSSPETLKGEKPDGRADLYSFGMILYRLCYGELPFSAEKASEIIAWHLYGELPVRGRLRETIPPYFSELISLLIQKAPSQRIAKAKHIIDFINKMSGLGFRIETKESMESYFKNADLVGRKNELDRISNLISLVKDPASRAMHPFPTLVIIEGESGIGKSRLLKEIKNCCQLCGLDVISGYCYEGSISPYGPFREIFKNSILLARTIQRAEKDAKIILDKYIQTASNFAYAPEKNPSPEHEMHEELEKEKVKLVDTLSEFLIQVSEFLPLIIFIEDLHWCDENTLFLLEFLARNAQGKRILIIATTRKEDSISEAITAFLSKNSLLPFTERMPLSRLRREDVTELISSMIGKSHGVDALSDRIFTGTNGNPLFIEEVMKSVAEDINAEIDLNWQEKILQYQEKIKIPSTVTGAIGKRIGRLDDRSLLIIRYLAVVDRPSPPDLIEMASGRNKEDIESAFADLLRRGIIRTEENNERLFAFSHTLVKDYILETLSASERKKLHGDIGNALLNFEKDGSLIEELAYHFVNAEDTERAVSFSLRAAERASRLYAHDRAIEHYQNSLRFIPEDLPEKRVNILLKLGESMLDSGAMEEGIACFEKIVAICRLTNRKDVEALSMERMGWAYSLIGKLEPGKEMSEKAFRLYESLNDRAGMAKALNNLGLAYARMGAFERALGCFLKSLQFWKILKNSFYSINLINNIGLVHYHMGNLQSSIQYLKKALRESKSHDHRKMTAAALNNLGIVFKKLNQRDEAIDCYKKCLIVENELGDKLNIAKTCQNLSELFRTATQYKESIQLIEKALTILKNVGDKKEEAFYYESLGNIYQLLGRFQEARQLHMKSLDLSNDCRDKILQGYSYLSLGSDYLLEGNLDDARSSIAEALKLSEELNNNRLKFKGLIRSMSLSNAEQDFAATEKAYNNFLKLTGKSLLDIEDICEGQLLFAEALLKNGQSGRAIAVLDGILKDTEEQDLKEQRWLAIYYRALAWKNKNPSADIMEQLKNAWKIIKDIASGITDEQLRKDYLDHPRRKQLFLLLKESEEGESMESTFQHDGMKSPPSKMLATLYEIVQMINSILDPDELLEKLMDFTIDVVGAERGLIILMDENSGEFSVRVARNLEKETIRDASRYSHSIVKEAGEGKSILTLDALNDDRFKKSRSVSLYNIRSLMCVPMKLHNKVIGTLYLDSRKSGPLFSRDDLMFVEALANHAAIAIEKANLYAKLKLENEFLKNVAHQRYRFDNIIGNSDGMKRVFSMIERVVESSLPVLIVGESGTGKELVARAIHFNGSRKNNIFMSENCSAISETLLASELFGHMKGSFTGATQDRKGLFEIAKDGTLFLDEIGDMSLSMQSKLLRAIQEGEIRPIGSKKIIKVNPRIISASNQDLKKLIEEKKFREDLYYRLNVIQINIPPLRDRKEDIPLLVHHFCEKIASENKASVMRIDNEVINILINYRWPGNVRELENAIKRLSLIATNSIIDMQTLKSNSDLYSTITEQIPFTVRSAESAEKEGREKVSSLREKEKEMVISALEESGGNREHAAKMLGVSRATIFRKIKEYEIK